MYGLLFRRLKNECEGMLRGYFPNYRINTDFSSDDSDIDVEKLTLSFKAKGQDLSHLEGILSTKVPSEKVELSINAGFISPSHKPGAGVFYKKIDVTELQPDDAYATMVGLIRTAIDDCIQKASSTSNSRQKSA